mmetsp:Transcript_3181/g.3694  ORF Transcript_3181/g.3694 Transcript_3181/m.3694 type:complete len:259 (-) Transcript_3181:63-839(-)
MFSSTRTSQTLENRVLIDTLLEKKEDLSIKLLDGGDENEMVDICVDAFMDDPMFQWIANIPDSNQDKEESLRELCQWSIRGINRAVLRQEKGAVFGVMEGTEIAGAMALVPSGCQPPGIFALLKYALLECGGLPPWMSNKANYGKWTDKRIDEADYLTKHRKRILEPHPKNIYLQLIGVGREFQGKGVGGKLFRMLFAAADALQAAVYLETEAEENETLYHHYGFQTVETITISAKGDTSDDAQLKNWLMLRLPKSRD